MSHAITGGSTIIVIPPVIRSFGPLWKIRDKATEIVIVFNVVALAKGS